MAHDILIVDDEADIRALVAGILSDENFDAREADTDTEALEAIEKRRPSLVLLDIWLEGSHKDGIEILIDIKKRHPALPVVMMSGHGTVETAVKAIKHGAYDFIEKPFKSEHLLQVVERAIEAANLKRENEDLRARTDSGGELVGTSSAIIAVVRDIERVAPSNSRVLFTGPPGSGKEIAARLLHDHSTRSTGPFIVVNCATMEPQRMEEELFGTETPVDDGEGGRRVGYFEAAHKGTLFMDEVADMPLETQGKIVRVLQEQIFSRVGGTTRVEVDVRVVASATRDMKAEIANGNFREDLFYRLSVVPITIPPLKSRREDLPALAAHFIARAAKQAGQPVRALAEDTVAALQAYEWPGNVRELRNVIERLVIMAPGEASDPVRAEHLPSEVSGNETEALPANPEIMGLALRDARETFERQYLLAQVMRFNGNIAKTAQFVGMERSALHRKLKSLGISTDDLGKKVEV